METLSKIEALEVWNKWKEAEEVLLELDSFGTELRAGLESLSRKNEHYIQKRELFYYDVAYAIGLHKYFHSIKIDTLRNMSDDGFWRYLSVTVAPHVVAKRHVKPEYYFSKPNRVWLKCMWWLIHLTWQGDYESTKRLLLCGKFSTDSTVALCERTGSEGTNVELYRAIVRKGYEATKFRMEELRRVMKLNTVKSLVVEPSLYSGGVEGYAESLFKDLNIK